MSQVPRKINEGSFLCQRTFIYFICFLLKMQTQCSMSCIGWGV